MKRILFFLLLLISFEGFGQVKQKPVTYGVQYRRVQADSAMRMPTVIIGIKDAYAGFDTAQFRYNKTDSTVKVYTGSQWIDVVRASGSGTVTSVGLSMPSIFSVSGSPVTGSGTLAASLATQAANLVFAGPFTGAAAVPTFRALAAADFPAASPYSLQTVTDQGSTTTNDIGINIDPTANFHLSGTAKFDLGSDATGDVFYRNASGFLTRLPVGSNGQVLTLASGLPSWAAAAGGGITVNSTTITSGTDTRIAFNDAGLYSEDNGLTWTKGSDALTVLGYVVSPIHYGSTAANGDVTIEGTSNATKTSSYVILQPTSGNVGIGTSTPTSLFTVGADQFQVASTGVTTIGKATGTTGKINLVGTTSGTVGITTAAAAGTWTFELPANDGDASQVLTTDGSGVTTWTTPSSGSPAGNFGNLQIGRNSAFATPASDSLDFESATGLSVKGDVRTTTSLYLPSSSSEGLRFGTTVRMYDDGSKIRISPSAGTLQFFTSGSNANVQIYNGAGDSYFGFTPLSGTGSIFETAGSATNLKMQNTAANTLMIGNGTAVAKTNILSTTEQLRLMYDASNYVAHTVSSAGVYTVGPTGASVTVTKPVVLKNYTVATLPTGVQGMICYVTDATAPTYGATLVGGGAVVTMAFFDGTNWTAH